MPGRVFRLFSAGSARRVGNRRAAGYFRSVWWDEDLPSVQEVELKFDIGDGGAEAIRHTAILSGARPKSRWQDSLYYDTPDGALRRAGFALRVRRSGQRYIQTIKRGTGPEAGLFVRQEWESEVPGFAPDLEAVEASPLRRRLAAVDDLVPLIRTRVRRTAWQVRHNDAWIEVALDEGSVAGGKTRAPLNELELELLNGQPAAIFDLAEAIAAEAPLRLGVLNKLDRGYALAEGKLGRAAKAEPVAFDLPVTEAAAFCAIVQSCLRHFRLNEMVLLERRDVDALHQARVALRRLRAALSLFQPLVRGKEHEHLKDELRWLAGQMGDARNLDVLIERLGDDEVTGGTLGPLRDRAYERVEEALRAQRTRAAMLRLSTWTELGRWRRRKRAGHDLSGLAADRLEHRWRRVARDGEMLADLDVEARHALRIATKKLRYAAEFLAPLLEGSDRAAARDRFLSALKTLQERLGDLNDAASADLLAAQFPVDVREAIKAAHAPQDQARALQSAEKAIRRAEAVSGYWRGG